MGSPSSALPDALAQDVERLKAILIDFATGGGGDEAEYRRLRSVVLGHPLLGPLAPPLLKRYRNLAEFWAFIKEQSPTYAGRRKFLREAFETLLAELDGDFIRGGGEVELKLRGLGSDFVAEVWRKARLRCVDDPDGAITAARNLMESVCKHILDDLQKAYSPHDDLPALYSATAQELRIAPSQHTERVFRQILGGCQSVVEGLGALRNRLSDSHGQGKAVVRPARRHGELAVDLAGGMAAFLVATWEERPGKSALAGVRATGSTTPSSKAS